MTAFLHSFVYAWRGIAQGARGRNFRVMLAVAVGAVILGWATGITRIEWAVVSACIGLVLGLELMNTAGEALVDLIHPDQDPRYGRIKDLLAGGVLVAALASLGAGLFIFLPRIFEI